MDMIDRETFVVIDSRFAKDKKHVYYKGKILKDIDTDTFEYLNIFYNHIDPVWGTTCQIPEITFKDKNGEYSTDDIESGKLELIDVR